MGVGSSHGNGLFFRTLTEKQAEEIHLASCQILEDTGMVIHHEEAVELLRQAGAHVEKGNRVYFPSSLVKKALQTAPSRVTLYNRQGEAALHLEGSNVYFGTGSDTLNYLDPFTFERRNWTKADVANAIRICDKLPNIDFVMSMGLLSDADPRMINREQYAIMVQNTEKPQVVIAEDGATLQDIIEMAACAVGGKEQLRHKPLFMIYTEPTSPLQHPKESIEKLLIAAENGVPSNFACGGVAGASVPTTVAGALVQANAEALSGLVIHQLKAPGAPFVYGYGNSPLDMRSMQAVYGTPEAVLFQGGAVDLAHYYQLPSWGYAGCSNSKVCDEQAIAESTMFTLMGALQGCNIMHDVFYMEFGITGSLELLVISNEVIGRTRRLLKGINTDKESLGVEAIKRVGPGGNFLGDEHTAKHFRDNWFTDLSDFNNYENWTADGSKTMIDRARDRIKLILETHQPKPVSEEVKAQIEEILSKAQEKFGGKF
ncbi:trimethylamine methyltransferase family protein [Desulfosporosinus meridiei]|uniref:Trimethylamine:corrinoid methyltransferase n=1 Tax=Desulfosporosinus meridiei (strain ATCC BAA-275 / DSM 13257 / KCTC 12902 / NCIMB 13706 / S10) TaxID=768704 RepID=J7J3N5_DESMD|nr:trimethylamine methyltransferase family protein [Desulfosporosinus meridiei]AFQ45878.1 trimethylamine:corrinoid methyltransferase [Desulfosporosinus meridiei DSM 13257]